MNPKKSVIPSTFQYFNSYTKMQETGLRRSARLAIKEKKSYEDPYDSDDSINNSEVDDIRDPDYKMCLDKWQGIDEKYLILPLFREKTKRWNPSEEQLAQIINKFQEWFDKYKDDKEYKSDTGDWPGYTGCWWAEYDNKYKITGYHRKPIREIIDKYVGYNRNIYKYRSIDTPSKFKDNDVLFEVINMAEFKYTLQRELHKIGINYEEKLFTGFVKWYKENVDSLIYSHKWLPNVIYRRPRDYIIKVYIKTITKVCLI